MKKKGIPGPKYKRRSGIYRITSITTGQTYIGKSKNLHQRFCQHEFDLKFNWHPNEKMQILSNLHGHDDFLMELVELVDDESKLDDAEAKWIAIESPPLNIAQVRLSQEKANMIRRLYAEGTSAQELATRYDTTPKYIKELLSGKKWKQNDTN